MVFKKRKKAKRYAGSQTHGRGAKERTRASGSRGGYGMAGTGKRGDQRKTLVIKLSGGNNYFGKDKTLRAGNKPKKLSVINLNQISEDYAGQKEINLEGYKILGDGELNLKAKIKATSASASAIDKIKASGSTLELRDDFTADAENEEESEDEEEEVKPVAKPVVKKK